jgi:mRNA interferase MazF
VTFKPFEIVTFAFPYVEKPGFVIRPVVVLSDHKFFLEQSGIYTVAMITSARATDWPLDVPLSELDGTGLTRPCVVRMKLSSAALELVDRRIGEIAKSDQSALAASLRQLFPYL